MSSRNLRRKKTNSVELKIAIVGAPNVGKTALIVRYLTKRYIGEYDHRPEARYKHETDIDGEPAIFEILDTCKKSEQCDNIEEMLRYADGIMLVFSITDHDSFEYLKRIAKDLHIEMPMHLVGNMADMLHLRTVDKGKAQEFANTIQCKYTELSAADQVEQVVEVFQDLCKEIYTSKRKSKQSLLERMLSSARPYSRGKSDTNLPKE